MTRGSYSRHWFAFGAVVVASFGVLGYYGRELYRQAPPIPDRVVTPDGSVIFTGQQRTGGQGQHDEVGARKLHGRECNGQQQPDLPYRHNRGSFPLSRPVAGK